MAISKKIRQSVFEKYHGRCAYCGCEITPNSFQVDHLWPKRGGGNDDYGNLMPSCRSCNNYKSSHTIVTFRKALDTMLNNKLHYLFRSKTKKEVAENYGVVTIQKWDGKFYFENFEYKK